VKCDKLKDMLMTDYIDGRCAPDLKREIDEHLAVCVTCRQFYSVLVKNAAQPFKGLRPLEAPAGMWEEIKGRIEEKEEALASVSRIFFPVRRAVFALAAFAMVAGLLVGVKAWRLYDTDLMAKYTRDQLYYFSLEETDEGSDNGSFGTVVEEFLL